MSRRIPVKILSLLFALGLLTYILTGPDEVSRAQTGDFDRTQYAADRPIGELETQGLAVAGHRVFAGGVGAHADARRIRGAGRGDDDMAGQ